jgi:hypothetical protein
MQFRRFEPLHDAARVKIRELLDRGGRIIVERREYVEIIRYQSRAKIDQWGRVEWRNEVRS